MTKENIIKMKREPTVWKNIFVSGTSDKSLIFKIYKELTRLLQEDKQPNKKMCKRLEQALSQGGHIEGPETYEKMLCLASHQRDANSNHNEIPLYNGENGHHKQINKQQLLERMWRKGNHSALLVGMQTGAATVENSMEYPQKTKNGTVF